MSTIFPVQILVSFGGESTSPVCVLDHLLLLIYAGRKKRECRTKTYTAPSFAAPFCWTTASASHHQHLVCVGKVCLFKFAPPHVWNTNIIDRLKTLFVLNLCPKKKSLVLPLILFADIEEPSNLRLLRFLVKCFDIWFGNHRGVIFTRDVSRAGFAVLIYASMSMFLRWHVRLVCPSIIMHVDSLDSFTCTVKALTARRRLFICGPKITWTRSQFHQMSDVRRCSAEQRFNNVEQNFLNTKRELAAADRKLAAVFFLKCSKLVL